MTQPKPITPAAAAALLDQGALMVDIRETAERESGVIPMAAHAPLSALDDSKIPAEPGQAVIFHCKSGGRTEANAAALAHKVSGSDAYLLEGGIEAWRSQGLPFERPD
ncbi:rhodanese-like domain-containing protein [Phenylobacterium sp.]|uniref:rhodanese-like domain-containing protein n=1 Tax=Phenylobacterium sp. TaxID=1871053 RepID=UPI002639D181|nr:rhodanese-like domain-containing protein [Phenylobacterium sp.]